VTAYMSRATHKSKLNLLLADISKGLLSILWNLCGQSVKEISGDVEDVPVFLQILIYRERERERRKDRNFHLQFFFRIQARHHRPCASTMFSHFPTCTTWLALTARNFSSTLH